MTDLMIERFGDDKVIWASDYPHFDGGMHVLEELEGALARLPESSRRNVLGESAVRFFGLNGAGRAVHGG